MRIGIEARSAAVFKRVESNDSESLVIQTPIAPGSAMSWTSFIADQCGFVGTRRWSCFLLESENRRGPAQVVKVDQSHVTQLQASFNVLVC